jgi:hypothetical protein
MHGQYGMQGNVSCPGRKHVIGYTPTHLAVYTSPTKYLVRANDTLDSISSKFGLAPHDVVALNPWINSTNNTLAERTPLLVANMTFNGAGGMCWQLLTMTRCSFG